MTNDCILTLTEAQKEVLRLVQRGMSTKEIAAALGVAPASVTDRIEGARFKLGGVRRATAARLLSEAEAGLSDPIGLGVNPRENGVSRRPLQRQLRTVADGGDEVREERTRFGQIRPQPLIVRTGPLTRSAAIVLCAIAFLTLAALIKPMMDGLSWLAEVGTRAFR